jgi:hypothetical protein
MPKHRRLFQELSVGLRRSLEPWNFAMVREHVTAQQLAEMIARKIAVADLEIVVRKDHAFGFQPTVLSAPGDLIGHQRRAEEIANRLRAQFE